MLSSTARQANSRGTADFATAAADRRSALRATVDGASRRRLHLPVPLAANWRRCAEVHGGEADPEFLNQLAYVSVAGAAVPFDLRINELFEFGEE